MEESQVHDAAATAMAAETADGELERKSAVANAEKWQAVALDEDIAVMLCQTIPFVDVVCDVLGGATLLVEESWSAKSIIAASVDAAAAAGATVQRDRDQSQVAWLEEQATVANVQEEASAAAELEMEAASAQDKATVEEG